MKLLIAGGRNYKLNQAGKAYLDQLFFSHNFSELIEGEAPGIDSSAKAWGMSKEIPIKPFPANWTKYGKRAGILRNQEMINILGKNDLAIYFPGGRGTDDCYRRAVAASVPVLDLRERLDLVEEIK